MFSGKSYSAAFLIHLRDRWISGHLVSADKGEDILDGVKGVKGNEQTFRLEIRVCIL